MKPIPRHVRLHDLRHTAATLLLKQGVELEVVQRILRHTDPKITAMTYGHLDVEDLRKGMARFPVTLGTGESPERPALDPVPAAERSGRPTPWSRTAPGRL